MFKGFLYILVSVDFQLKLVFINIYFHTNKGVVVFEMGDVFVAHPDAALAASSGNTVAVARTAMNTNTRAFVFA